MDIQQPFFRPSSLTIKKAFASSQPTETVEKRFASTPLTPAVKIEVSEQARKLLSRGLATNTLETTKKIQTSVQTLTTAPQTQIEKPMTSLDLAPAYWKTKLPPFPKLQPVGFSATHYQTDVNYFVVVDNNTPKTTLYVPSNWTDRDGSEPGSTKPVWQMEIRLPDDFVIPDVSVAFSPNNPTAVYNKDTGEFLDLNGVARPVAGGPIYAYRGNGTHAGSGMSFGEITQAELEAGKIPHALAITVEAAKFLSFANGTGFTPPATKADAYANAQTYGGKDPKVMMGSRLAMPRHLKAEDLGITSRDGKNIFRALRQYGAYIVDDSGWDSLGLSTDTGAANRVEKIVPELQKMYQNLALVL
jgi:hypothetical protein